MPERARWHTDQSARSLRFGFQQVSSTSIKERRFLALARATRSVGTPYLIPPGTPKELVQILRSAMKKTFQDPEFHKEAKKLTGEDPTPLMPEAQEELIRAVPRDVETIELFKLINGTNPLPPR